MPVHSDNRSQVGFFGVVTQAQSYRSMLYLLFGLPLGTVYFTVLVTGLSLGVSLLLLALLGIPILIGLWHVVHGFAKFERALTMGLLEVEVAPISPLPERSAGLWDHLKNLVGHQPTRRAIYYLLLRFPAGIATFVLAVTAIAVSLGMALAPAYMWTSDELNWGSRTFDPFPWSFALVPLGVVFVFLALHLMNAVAATCGEWTRHSLGTEQHHHRLSDTNGADKLEEPDTATRGVGEPAHVW